METSEFRSSVDQKNTDARQAQVAGTTRFRILLILY